MRTETTREALIRIITEQQIKTGKAKLRIGTISNMAGITRQAFHRYHGDLKPYLLGEKPISALFSTEADGVSPKHLSNAQNKIDELQNSLAAMEKARKKELLDFKNNCVTSLMKSDLALHEADNVRKRHAQQISYNEKLRQDLTTLKLALLQEESRALTAEAELNHIKANPSWHHHSASHILTIDEFGFLNKKNTIQDEERFFELKNKCTEKTIQKINQLADHHTSTVILFIDRYISRFDKFVNHFISKDVGTTLLVRFPVHDQFLFRNYLSQVQIDARFHVAIPVCTIESIVKTQRAFFVRDVPAFEINNADEFALEDTSLKRCTSMGIDVIEYLKVSQGD